MLYIEHGEDKHPVKGAEIAESPIWDNAGILLDPLIVVVDIDCLSPEQLDEIEKRFDIHTQTVYTDRGRHYYFKRDPGYFRAKNGVCALGFQIEEKTAKNTPGGVCIKRNGKLREIKNEGIFQPLIGVFKDNKQYPSLQGMEEGQGRNNAIFALSQKYEGPDKEKVLRCANEVIFADPLPEAEFLQCIREWSGSDSADNESGISDWLRRDYKVVRHEGSLWFWNGEEYVTDPEDDDRLNKLIRQRAPGRKSSFVEEVKALLRLDAYKIRYDVDAPFVIRFQNGILDRGEWVDFPGFSGFTPFFVNIPYDKNAEPVQDVDNYIDTLTKGDPDYRALLAEVLGFAFVTDPEMIRALGRFFIFRGDGRNGKSTLFSVLKTIFTPRNCSYLSIRQIGQEKYQTSLLGKLANLGDDLEPDAINNEQMKAVKNIATADSVEARRLYQQPFYAQYTVKLYFTANSDIRTFEKGYAYQRRVMWLPMFNVIDKVDPFFKSKLTSPEALKYWIRYITEGYFRLYQNRKFTDCKLVEDYNARYHLANNHMAEFASSVDLDLVILGKMPKEVEAQYYELAEDTSQKYNSKLLKEYLSSIGIELREKRVEKDKIRRVFMRVTDTKPPQQN